MVTYAMEVTNKSVTDSSEMANVIISRNGLEGATGRCAYTQCCTYVHGLKDGLEKLQDGEVNKKSTPLTHM